MKKAGNMVEISIILGVVAVVTVGTLLIYRNQDLRLMVLSAINFRPVNLQTMSQDDKVKLNVPYNRVETAGGNALTNIGWTSADFESAITHVSYGNLDDAFKEKDGVKGIDTYANNLINDKLLNLMDYTPLTATNITSKTLSDLIGILNTITSPSIEAFKQEHPEAASDVDGFLKRFNDILTVALADSKNPTTASSSSSSIANTPSNGEVAGSSSDPGPGTAGNSGSSSYGSLTLQQGSPQVSTSGGVNNAAASTSTYVASSPSSTVKQPAVNKATGTVETIGKVQSGKIEDTPTTPTTSNTTSSTSSIKGKKSIPAAEPASYDDDIIPAASSKKTYTVVKQQAVKPQAYSDTYDESSYNVVSTPAKTTSTGIKSNVSNAIETSGIRAQDLGGKSIQNIGTGH